LDLYNVLMNAKFRIKIILNNSNLQINILLTFDKTHIYKYIVLHKIPFHTLYSYCLTDVLYCISHPELCNWIPYPKTFSYSIK